MHIRRVPMSLNSPFTVADLAAHVRVDEGSELHPEAVLKGQAAAAEIENYGQLALLNQTITVTLEGWPLETRWPLPVAPASHTHDWTVTCDGEPFAGVILKAGFRPELWLTANRPEGQVVITYVAGFGDTAEQVPADLRHAIMDQAAAFFDQRGITEGLPNGLSPHAARIVARYRRVGL